MTTLLLKVTFLTSIFLTISTPILLAETTGKTIEFSCLGKTSNHYYYDSQYTPEWRNNCLQFNEYGSLNYYNQDDYELKYHSLNYNSFKGTNSDMHILSQAIDYAINSNLDTQDVQEIIKIALVAIIPSEKKEELNKRANKNNKARHYTLSKLALLIEAYPNFTEQVIDKMYKVASLDFKFNNRALALKMIAYFNLDQSRQEIFYSKVKENDGDITFNGQSSGDFTYEKSDSHTERIRRFADALKEKYIVIDYPTFEDFNKSLNLQRGSQSNRQISPEKPLDIVPGV